MQTTQEQNQKIRKFWDEGAEKWVFDHPIDMSIINQYCKKNQLILDVGSGYGRNIELMKNHGYNRTFGVEVSPNLAKLSRHQTVLYDGKFIPIRENSIDLILIIAVLSCVVSDDLQRDLITECHRILKPGGMIYLSEHGINKSERYTKLYADSGYEHGIFNVADGVLVRHHKTQYLLSLLDKFNVLCHKEFDFITSRGNTAGLIQIFARKS